MTLFKILFILFGTLLSIEGEQWYTASLENYPLEGENYKPNFVQDGEHKYKPVNPISTQKLSPTVKKVGPKGSEVTTVYPMNRGVIERNINTKSTTATSIVANFNGSPKFPYKYEVEAPAVLPKNHTFAHTHNVSNLNVLNRTHTKRRIVKKCPTIRRHQKNSTRKSKFLEVFEVVQFEHVPCTSSSGLDGVCLHEYECRASGGLPMGGCADGYGTCCVTLFQCGDQSNAQTGWFTNPGFPTPSTERLSCAITLNKASPDIQQYRLDFLIFELLQPNAGTCQQDQLLQPNAGTCQQDQFVISGQNINSAIPILCGVNNGQHMYVEVGDVDGPIYLSVQTVTDDTRLYAVKVTQLTSADELAPTGCLQYYTAAQGFLESFNYQEKSTIPLAKNPSYLNNFNYAMCIQRKVESCSITYTNTGVLEIVNYDADGLPLLPPEQAGVEIFNCPSDWLLIAAARLCGDRLNDGTVLQDFSLDAPVTDIAAGPIVVWFRSDGSYVGRGFRLQYQQNPCLSPA